MSSVDTRIRVDKQNASTTRFSSFYFVYVATMKQTRQTNCLEWNLRTTPPVRSELSTPLRGMFGFSLDEPLGLFFSMRPSIPVSQDATKRLGSLVRLELQLHKDEMRAPSAPHCVRRDKVTIFTTNTFLRGQPNMKLCD
jgi:hypothetical protein